tara:strand:+ start:430 stop:996 length:567 start_codon:yes stop_codon:yes gene_type:complete
MTNKINKTSRKGSKHVKWTVKDTNTLLRCKDRKEVRELAPALNRSESACIQRWSSTNKLMKTKKAAPSPKSTKKDKSSPKPQKKQRRKYVARWTPEEELYLLCNFYELSVDEAKAQFDRSYGAIASQLEKIIESDKPEHIAMLRKAAVIITERKKAEQKPVKLSRRERRLLRKKTKLQKRLDKMGDKF